MRRPSGRVLLEGAARFFGVVAVASIVACLAGILLGAFLHQGVRRGIAIGFYLTGSFLAGCGVLMATRPPVRGKSAGGVGDGVLPSVLGGFFSSGGIRWASRDEHREAMNVPAVFVTVGVTLVLIGAFVDVRH